MDTAVALAQAYLQLNGYLTVAEFPIVGPHGDDLDVITDVDLIALRFPLARSFAVSQIHTTAPDPELRIRHDVLDLLICEVKEGKARLNPNLKRAEVLRAALTRLGCCPPQHIDHHVRELLRHGAAEMRHAAGLRCRARIAIFAGRVGGRKSAALVISLRHAVEQVCRFLREHAAEVHAVQLSQPALAQLQLLEKLGLLPRTRAAAASASVAPARGAASASPVEHYEGSNARARNHPFSESPNARHDP